MSGDMSGGIQSGTQNESQSESNGEGSQITPDGKQVPIYQGMSISSATQTIQAQPVNDEDKGEGVNNAGNGNDNGNNGNHKGWYKGDHKDKENEIDEEKPFENENPDRDPEDTIEKETENSFGVIGAKHEIYYAKQNEDIYVHIHVFNPDSFEILSFTLNGKKYSSYMFEQGSDMETLILKYNVGEKTGITEYTIDAIKYVDGAEIKDVVIEGDKTVRAGVSCENQVYSEITNEVITQNSISFDAQIFDIDGLVEYTGGAFKAVLYDGEKIVQSFDLKKGKNQITFDNLETSKLYEYAVVGYFDDLRGDGLKLNVLAKKPFYTKSIVLFDKIEVSQDNISFDFFWNEMVEDREIISLKLYKGEEYIKDITIGELFVSGLLSNCEYSIVATFRFMGREESIRIDFGTAPKKTPTPTIENITPTKTGVIFDVAEIDEDGVGEVKSVQVLKNGKKVYESNEVSEISGLLSNNEYLLRVVYAYNLCDGRGNQSITVESEFTTLSKVAPEVEIQDLTATRTSVSFKVYAKDDDGTGKLTKTEIILNGEVVSESENKVEYTNLLSDREYTVRITYTYNLGDGNKDLTVVKTATFTTLKMAVPTVEIVEKDLSAETITFDVVENDVDGIGEVSKIELIHCGEVTEAESTAVRAFRNLLSNNAYTVRVTYTYNLNDGTPNREFTVEKEIVTIAKTIPQISFENVIVTTDGITFDVKEVDLDGDGEITSLQLLKGTEVIASGVDIREVQNLLSDNEYSLALTYVYDLNDGKGDITVNREYSFKTFALTRPTVEFGELKATKYTVTGTYEIIDEISILESYKVEVYKGNEFVSENTAKEINFENLNHSTFYTVKITIFADLNDGKGVQGLEYIKTITTNPFVSLDGCTVANTSAVSEGETIYLKAELNNPAEFEIESVVVNGITYPLVDTSTTSTVYVDIVHENQFEGGETELFIEKINYVQEGVVCTVEVEEDFSASVFINGKLELLDFAYVNKDFEKVEWMEKDEGYLYFEFSNKTGYNIDKIVAAGKTWTGSSLIKESDERYYIKISQTEGWRCLSVTSIDYSNTAEDPQYQLSKTLTFSNMVTDYVYFVKSSEAKYISTADDLLNMNGYYYYELTNDIDLSGREWQGGIFEGVFDGKGYSIKNMAFVSTVTNKQAQFGLFRSGTGIIQNLRLESVEIVAKVTSTDGESYEAYGGSFVAILTQNAIIRNCSVDASSIISIDNQTSDNTYVGGFVGLGSTFTLTNCENNGAVTANGNGVYVGGFVGYVSNIITLTDCINNGDVTADGNDSARAGGFVGRISGSMTATNCENNGTVTANSENSSALVGGFVGEGSTVTTTDCENNGNITASNNGRNYSAYAGGFVGRISGSMTATNCENNGDVTLSARSSAYAGGFVGDASTVNATNCINNGDVTAESENSSAYVGGFVGAGNTTTTDCENNGTVTANGGKYSAYAGGFVGAGNTTATDCENNGNITANNNGSNYSAYAGGFVGCISSVSMTATNCVNNGEVIATNNGNYFAYAGGLVGYSENSSSTTITKCINNGDVTANSGGVSAYAGGFVGCYYDKEEDKITNCINTGSVSGKYKGGFVGSGSISIENCYTLYTYRTSDVGCTVEQLNDKTFYTETLGFSEEVWNLDELDFENGKLPTLR